MFKSTCIPDVFVFEPTVFEDERGYFFESYNKNELCQAGIITDFVQDNQCASTYGVLRGLHFQKAEHAQSKLVRVLFGKVLDVAVDLRPHSPTYGQHFSIELSSENKKQLFIPRGFAHGYVVLSETAVFSYKCDNFYNKNAEAGIRFNDPNLNIDWQIPIQDIQINLRDKNFPTIQNAELI